MISNTTGEVVGTLTTNASGFASTGDASTVNAEFTSGEATYDASAARTVLCPLFTRLPTSFKIFSCVFSKACGKLLLAAHDGSSKWAIGSGVEHILHTDGVAGSNPASPTTSGI